MGPARKTRNTFHSVKLGKTNLWAKGFVKAARAEEERKNKDIQNKSNALTIIAQTLGNTRKFERTLRPFAHLKLDHTARSIVNDQRDLAAAQQAEKRKKQEYDAQLRRESADRHAAENDEFAALLDGVQGTEFNNYFGDLPGDPPLHRSTRSTSSTSSKSGGRKTRGRKTRGRNTRGRNTRGRKTRGR